MARSKFVSTVEDTTQVAAKKASEAFLDAAERLAPLIDQAGEYLGPLTEDVRRLSTDLASGAYSRVKPALRDAQIKGARLASDAYDRVHPSIDGALHAVPPAVDHAVGKVRPAVDDVLERIPPLVEGARSRVQDDVLPKVAGVLKDAASQPLAAEAAAQLALATAVVSKELRKSAKAARKRSWPRVLGKIVLAGALLAGVVVAIRKLITPPSEGWHAHSPSDAYVADPIADVADDVAEHAGDLADAVKEKVDDVKDAVSDVVKDATDAVGDAGKTVADVAGDIADKAGDVADKAQDAVEDATDKAQDVAGDLADKAQDAVEDATDKAQDVAEEVGDRLEDAAGQVSEAVEDATGDDASPFAGSPFGEESYVGSEPPEGYPVKANSRSHKFRLPGSSGYERATADVWFTSAEAAEAAGFVQAQR